MKTSGTLRTPAARFVLSLLSLLTLGACATTEAGGRAAPEATGEASAIEVSIHASPRDAEAGIPYDGAVVSRLVGVDDRAFVRESAGSLVSVEGLPAGRYRLEVVRWMGEDGQLREIRSPDGDGLLVGPGERVKVAVVLSEGRGLTATEAKAFAGHVVVPIVISSVFGVPVRVPTKVE